MSWDELQTLIKASDVARLIEGEAVVTDAPVEAAPQVEEPAPGAVPSLFDVFG